MLISWSHGFLLLLLLFFICGFILWKVFKVQWRNLNFMFVFKFRLFCNFKIILDILVTIVRIKTKLRIIFVFFLIPIHFSTSILAHDLLESFSFDEFYSVFLVNFVNWNTFVLKGEEKVYELAYLISIISLFSFNLSHFSLVLFEINHELKLFFCQHRLWSLNTNIYVCFLFVKLSHLKLFHFFQMLFLLTNLALGLCKLFLCLCKCLVVFRILLL